MLLPRSCTTHNLSSPVCCSSLVTSRNKAYMLCMSPRLQGLFARRRRTQCLGARQKSAETPRRFVSCHGGRYLLQACQDWQTVQASRSDGADSVDVARQDDAIVTQSLRVLMSPLDEVSGPRNCYAERNPSKVCELQIVRDPDTAQEKCC